jgi:hypothetical protein
MGGVSKIALVLLLLTGCVLAENADAREPRVVDSINFGFVVVFNPGPDFRTCFIQTNLGEFTVDIYPKDYSEPFRRITIVECW